MVRVHGESGRSGPHRRRWLALAVAVAAGTGLLGGCAADVSLRGNAPDPSRIAQLKTGISHEQVRELLGSPTNVSTFNGSAAWYYVSQRTRQVSFHAPEVMSRQVIAIAFNKQGKVDEIQTLGLKDGKDIHMVDRTTPTPGRQFTLMQQLLGNLGRFNNPEGGGLPGPGQTPPSGPPGG